MGKKLYLGGTRIPFHAGLQGHSDGDVILHAIIDALLGAMKKKDIEHPKLYFDFNCTNEGLELFYYSNQLNIDG